MLDEIDKLGHDFRGDPASALLEVLDPEQNNTFRDHYLEVPFDLSQVMFIATANILDPIPPALRDRLEVIELPGYTREEKRDIAQQFLVPKQLEEHGLTRRAARASTDAAVDEVIDSYTREAGVRNLEREIGQRRAAASRSRSPRARTSTRSSRREHVAEYLGPAEVHARGGRAHGRAGRGDGPGLDAGRRRHPLHRGHPDARQGQLVLTGQLGDVMKESAQAALSFVRSARQVARHRGDFLEKTDIHIHIPAGAIPKDGPSAGVTMFTALVSLLTGNRCAPTSR